MRRVAIALVCGLGAACTTKAGGPQGGEALAPASSTPTAVSRSPATGSASAAPGALLDPLDPSAPFLRAVRALDWDTAADSFDKLARGEQERPELRFARAYCARQLGDSHGVLGFSE